MALKDEPIFWVESYKPRRPHNGWCLQTSKVTFATAQEWLIGRLKAVPETKHRIKFKIFADIGEGK